MLPHRLFRWFKIFMLSTFMLLLLAWLLLPLYVRPVLEEALSRSLQQQVHIGHVQWDLSSGLLQVSDLDIAQQEITWRDLQLLIHWPALRHHIVDIAVVRLHSPQLTLIRDKAGVRLEGLPVIPATASTEESAPSPWRVVVHEVDVQYAQLQWQDGINQASAYVYWLHATQLDAAHYAVQARMTLDAAMTDQGLPQAGLALTIKGEVAIQDGTAVPNFTGHVVVKNTHADTGTMQLTGTQLSWDGYSMATAQAVAVHGNWQLDGLDVYAAPQAISIGSANWQGVVTWPLEQHGQAMLDGQWQVKPLHVVLDAYSTLDVAQSDWQGRVHVAMPTLEVEVDSQLDLAGLHMAGQNNLAVRGDNIHWKGTVKQRDKTTSLDGRWQIKQFSGTVADQPWSLDQVQWQGTMQAKQGKDELRLHVKQTLHMQGVQADALLAMKSLQWDGAWDVQQDQSKGLTFHSKQHHIAVNRFTLSPTVDSTTSLSNATWQGDVALVLCNKADAATCDNNLATTGVIKASQLHVNMAKTRQLRLDHATWQGSVKASGVQEAYQGDIKGDLTLHALRFDDKHRHLRLGDATWQGNVLASAHQAAYQGEVKSEIALKTLRFDDGEQHVRLADIGWQGALKAAVDGKARQASGQGDLQAHQFRWGNAVAPTQLASVLVEGLTVSLHDGVKQQLSASLAQLSLSSLLWPSTTWGHDGAVRLAQGKAQQLTVTMQRNAQHTTGTVALDTLHVSGIDAAWQRATTTKTNKSVQVAEPQPVVADSSNAEPGDWQWRVGAIKLDGDNHFAIRDDSIKPAWHSSVSDIYVEVGEIDSRHGDVATPFYMAAKLAPAGSAQVQGELFLHDTKQGALVLHSTAQLNGFDAAPLSGYVESVSGYAIQRGTVQADLDAHVLGSKVKSTLKLRLDHLKITPQTATVIDTMQGLIGLSPEAALDTLRDSSDSIKLDIPISGDLSAPDFKLKSVVQKALGGSLQKGALMYLQYAFQPYGAMLGVAMWVGKEIHTIRLPSIPVALGAVEATPKARDDILRKAASVLQRTPTAALAVCGQAVPADFYAQVDTSKPVVETKKQEVLLNLARLRGEAIIQFLQQTLHVPARQLQRCRPEIVDEKTPSIKLML